METSANQLDAMQTFLTLLGYDLKSLNLNEALEILQTFKQTARSIEILQKHKTTNA